MPGPQLFVTPYGRAAAELLRARLSAAKADDPLHPVSVLVPTNYVGVSTRRLLASGALGPVTSRGSGIAGLALLTVYRLAELLGAPALAAAGRRPVSTPLIGAAVRRVLRTTPGIFGPVAGHPSTERALVRAHRELSKLTPGALDILARHRGRSAEAVRVHRAVRELILADWYEEADLMASAERALVAGSSVIGDLGTVLIYLPEDLSLPAAALLRALADATSVEVVAGMTGVAQADADVVRSLDRLGAPPPSSLMRSEPGGGDVEGEGERSEPGGGDVRGEGERSEPGGGDVAVEVVTVSDADEEARSAVACVVAAARDGMPLERMAILYPSAEPYARIVHEHLDAATITCNGAAVRPLTDRMVGRWLLDLLDLRNRDFDRPSVMGLLTSAPVVDQRGRWLPAGTWERITRDAGIVHGRTEWVERLRRYADDEQRRADAPEVDAPAWRAERSRSNARRAGQLADTVQSLMASLGRAERLRTWPALSAWCRHMLGTWIDRRRDGWPQTEIDAADRVEAALDRLAGLDVVEPETDLSTFRRALESELDDDLGRTGELGRGVLVGTPAAALGVDLDLVVVLGLAEGVAPTTPREDSLLPDADRWTVADQLRPRTDRVGVEHRHLLAALAGARRRRVLVQPRGDLRRSVDRPPSRWLLDAVEQVDGSAGRARLLPHDAPWLDVVPSFAGRVRRSGFPATRQDYALRALADISPSGAHGASGLSLHPIVAADADLRRAVTLVRQRAAGRFGRFTGRLEGRAARMVADAMRDRVTSASALEAWLACPHAFLMDQVLRVRPVDNPEEVLRISARDSGSVFHDVLDRWLTTLLVDAPGPAEPWPAPARALMGDLAERSLGEARARGVTGHPLLWRRDRERLVAEFADFVGRDDQRRREATLTPVAAELEFGFANGVDPLVIALGDGRSIRVRGRIDRVDMAADGTVYVADYKTGSDQRFRALSADAPLAAGDKLQLPIYGLAVRAAYPDAAGVHTEYWFVSRRGDGRRIGYRLTDDVVARLLAALRVIADGIGDGLFPMRPPDGPSWNSYIECVFCDPDGLGTSDLFRQWERIRTNPMLRDYLAAVDPDALAAHEDATPDWQRAARDGIPRAASS